MKRLRVPLSYPTSGGFDGADQATCRGGSVAVESVAAFAWNGWQASSGISGNLGLEYAFREIVDPNFTDFYWDFQSNEVCDRAKLTRVFRKLVNLALTLNHQADKVAKKLKFPSANALIGEVIQHYPVEGAALNAVRSFSNDVKHQARLDSSFTTRKRALYDQPTKGEDLPEWYFTTESGQKVAVCNSAVDAYLFWGKWFAGERVRLSENT